MGVSTDSSSDNLRFLDAVLDVDISAWLLILRGWRGAFSFRFVGR